MNTEDQLLSTFKSFIKDINNIIPSTGDEFINEYKEVLDMDKLEISKCTVVSDFMDKINENIDGILDENEEIFKIAFLKGVNLNELIDINRNKEYIQVNIWKYFQTFALISINFNSSNELHVESLIISKVSTSK